MHQVRQSSTYLFHTNHITLIATESYNLNEDLTRMSNQVVRPWRRYETTRQLPGNDVLLRLLQLRQMSATNIAALMSFSTHFLVLLHMSTHT